MAKKNKDSASSTVDERSPLKAHLNELVYRLRRVVLWLFLGAGLGYFVAGDLIHYLQMPLIERLPADGQLIYTTPFEKVWVYLRVSMLSGFVLLSPLLAYEVLAFVGPAFHLQQRKRWYWTLPLIALATMLGVLLGYFLVLPLLIKAILSFTAGAELPFLSLGPYINTALGVLLFSALFFQLPLWMALLSRWGWISSRLWKKGRRLAIVINALLSAFLSPPDVLSMLLMMIPLQFLYEFGILGAGMAKYSQDENKK